MLTLLHCILFVDQLIEDIHTNIKSLSTLGYTNPQLPDYHTINSTSDTEYKNDCNTLIEEMKLICTSSSERLMSELCTLYTEMTAEAKLIKERITAEQSTLLCKMVGSKLTHLYDQIENNIHCEKIQELITSTYKRLRGTVHCPDINKVLSSMKDPLIKELKEFEREYFIKVTDLTLEEKVSSESILIEGADKLIREVNDLLEGLMSKFEAAVQREVEVVLSLKSPMKSICKRNALVEEGQILSTVRIFNDKLLSLILP